MAGHVVVIDSPAVQYKLMKKAWVDADLQAGRALCPQSKPEFLNAFSCEHCQKNETPTIKPIIVRCGEWTGCSKSGKVPVFRFLSSTPLYRFFVLERRCLPRPINFIQLARHTL